VRKKVSFVALFTISTPAFAQSQRYERPECPLRFEHPASVVPNDSSKHRGCQNVHFNLGGQVPKNGNFFSWLTLRYLPFGGTLPASYHCEQDAAGSGPDGDVFGALLSQETISIRGGEAILAQCARPGEKEISSRIVLVNLKDSLDEPRQAKLRFNGDVPVEEIRTLLASAELIAPKRDEAAIAAKQKAELNKLIDSMRKKGWPK